MEKRQITVKSEGDFAVLAFFSVVASSQILPQCYKYVLISMCKVNTFFRDKQERGLFFDVARPCIWPGHNLVFRPKKGKASARFSV